MQFKFSSKSFNHTLIGCGFWILNRRQNQEFVRSEKFREKRGKIEENSRIWNKEGDCREREKSYDVAVKFGVIFIEFVRNEPKMNKSRSP
jgi:hypothetical protein